MQAFLRGISRAAVVAAVLIGVVVPATFAVELAVLSTAKEEAPGSFVTHVFAITNDGAAVDTYGFTFDAPEGWGILGAPASITVAAGAEETLFVTLTIPPGALAGAYDVTLSAASQEEPGIVAAAVATVIVTPAREIELLPPAGASVAPGGGVEYEFVLLNRGNVQDSFSLEASSSQRFPIDLTPGAVDLAPQERITILAHLDVPADAAPGRDALTVTACSTLYDGVETEAAVFTTILPPGPEGIGSTLMEILPARIRLSLDKDVLTGEFGSRLTFSVSGQIQGGFFSSNLSLSDPLGSDPLEIGSFSILYRRSPVTYTIGSVSQRLTDLIRLSCLGGSIVIDEELLDLSIIAGGSDEETRFAGRLAIGPERANLGIAYLGIRDPSPTYQSVWSATATAEPLTDWTIEIEGALGIDGSLSSRAFRFHTEIDTSGLFFSAAAFSVGTYFPGALDDSAGIEVSYRLRLPAVSLSTSLEHVWDNVIRDPSIDTLIQDELGFNLTTTPLEDGPTLRSTVELTWDRYHDLGVKSEIESLVAVRISETSGVFPYEISGKITDQIDHVLDTHVRRSTFSEGAGLAVDSFYLYLELTQEKQVDVVRDLVLFTSSDASVRFRPEGSLHEASIVFRNAVDEFDLAASLYIRFVENLDIVFDGSISWDRVDSDSVSFGWGVSLNANVEIPTPFFVTKGQIEGRVFVDLDRDGMYGLYDRPLGGVVVAADRVEASTDAEGRFRFPPFYPSTYALTARQLPVDVASGEPLEVDLGAGKTVWVDMPVAPVVLVTGRLFGDEDQDGIPAADEGGFAQVRVLLTDEAGVVRDAYTDLDGAFHFADVPPGRYTLGFDAETLPDRFAFTTAEEQAIEVGAEAPPTVAFGGFIRPREVIVTFQPPTADFTVSPDPPRAGEPATFDGTSSFDFDGEIVSYAWDFDGDGAGDAVEPIASYTFAEPGVWDVALTVVDNSGNSDTITLPIEVREPVPDAGPASGPTFQPPIADFAFIPAAPVAGEIVRFDGTPSSDFDGEIVAYAWDFDGDGEMDAAGPTAERPFANPGTYTVALTVTDDSGNTDTISATIEVGGSTEDAQEDPSDGSPIAGFQHSPPMPIAGEPVQFNGTSSFDPDGQIVGFAWEFDGDDQVESTAPLTEHTFAEPGAYAITLTVTDDDGRTDSVSETIDVGAAREAPDDGRILFQPPVADFAYMPASPSRGDVVLFNGTFSSDFDGEIVAYAWDFEADGTLDATGPIAEYTFSAVGVHPVSLKVTDEDGNTDTVTLFVEIE